jgi:hypothetical protein
VRRTCFFLLVLIGILCWRIWYGGFYIRYVCHGGEKLVAGGALISRFVYEKSECEGWDGPMIRL